MQKPGRVRPGHSYPEPTVRFHGQPEEGFRALTVALLLARARFVLESVPQLEDPRREARHVDLLEARLDDPEGAASGGKAVAQPEARTSSSLCRGAANHDSELAVSGVIPELSIGESRLALPG